MSRFRQDFAAPWQPGGADTRSLWLEEALASEDHADPRELKGRISADVCIVGGGYVGLWTAIRLREDDPSLRVVLLEADVCGAGASGRNTGQALPLWSKLKTLTSKFGPERALWLAKASDAAVDELERFSRTREIEFRRTGWLWLGTSSAQMEGWDELLDECYAMGVEPFEKVSAPEAQERSGSPVYRGGLFLRSAAMLQPARLARELRRDALQAGVEIFERSPVATLDRERGVVSTAKGSVSTETVVLALGGWSGAVHELRRLIAPVSAEIIATEPLGDRAQKLGWKGREAITNARLTLRYTRRTEDDRVLFGRAGARLGFDGRIGRRFASNPAGAELLQSELPRFVPAAAGARITHAWAGPVDRSSDGLPIIGEIVRSRCRILYATGFSGNGVGPALMASRSLSSMALRVSDDWSDSPLVNRYVAGFPPEPIRFLGGQLIRHAVTAKENREEEGAHVPAALTAVSRLAPGGLASTGAKTSSREEAS